MKKPQTHKIRIIAGKHKGRRIEVLDSPGLRPSPDRVRETLFNWLQFLLPGAHVLDAFAGSGVLGLEALSRQAGSVVFFEKDSMVANRIRDTLTLWRESHARVQVVDTLSIAPGNHPFDIIFIDPPFAENLHKAAIDKFIDQAWLKPQGLLYVEMPQSLERITLPVGIDWYKRSKAGRLHFGLLQRVAS